jgi:hypothetical protein
MPMTVIAKQLDHADTRMTEKHYAHLAPHYIADTIRANFPRLGIADAPSVVVPLRHRQQVGIAAAWIIKASHSSLGLNRESSWQPAALVRPGHSFSHANIAKQQTPRWRPCALRRGLKQTGLGASHRLAA